MFLLVPAYPGCRGSKAVKRSLLLSLLYVLTNQSGPSGQICLAFSNAEVSVNLSLAKKILLRLCVRVEVSSVESNETTAATVSCDLAPPPQRRRRRYPPPPPPRNLPFVTLPRTTVFRRHHLCQYLMEHISKFSVYVHKHQTATQDTAVAQLRPYKLVFSKNSSA